MLLEYEKTFINRTDFALTITPLNDEFDAFTISPHEEKTIRANNTVIIPRISGNSVLYSVSAENSYEDRNTYIITQAKKTTYDITFINNTDFSLSISSKYHIFDDFIINPDETKVIKSTNNDLFYPEYVDEIGDYSINDHMEGTTCIFSQTLIDVPDPYENYSSYLGVSDYNSLISNLSSSINIDRSMIDSYLNELKVKQNYEYSFYSSENYICHTLKWSSYSSYTHDWIYYVSVDIWTDSAGNLRKSMCSYYSD